MSYASSVPRLHSPFISCPHKFSASPYNKSSIHQHSPTSYPSTRAVDLDQNLIVAISVGVASVTIEIGIPVFYETQIDNAAKRENTQSFFPCNGIGARANIFMLSLGDIWSSNTIDLYLHHRYYDLVDPENEILKQGQEIFLTGCCFHTTIEGFGYLMLIE